MKYLHISFHKGCHNDLEYISSKLGIKIDFMEFTDGTIGKYNIGHERAEKYWNDNKDFLNQYDCIITSDTAPISRVFLQNNWDKLLIIWINNRFDYCDVATLDCEFPDKEYYELFETSIYSDNVHVIGYTAFENYYCKEIKKIDIGNNIIKPIGKPTHLYNTTNFVNVPDVENTFFVGPYHNDNIMMNLAEQLKSMEIPVYNGRFNGPLDLARFKGVVHIPYAWSNYAFFEGLQLGIVYFIPSKQFLLELKEGKDFFWSPPYEDKNLELSEWYCEKNTELLVYFNSWLDLKIKLFTTNYKKKKELLKEFCKTHTEDMLGRWKTILL